MTGVLIRRRDQDTDTHRGHMRTQGGDSVYTPRTEASVTLNPADSLLLGFQPADL